MFEAKLAALTHGASGLVLGYASVAIPMVAVLIRRRAPLSKLLLSPVQAVPVMLVAGVAMELTSLLSRSLGVVSEGWLSLTLDVVTAIGVGYASGRLLARRPSADSSYRRGAIVSHEN